uniref:AlNc14C222G9131 protein n=1 Tax=Albugo laibachii Nc14 TaxID=890382 RepID=F0WRY8_9STRA|nr:AlNc14C222G9131 [Albugo laibachii Nc14]|eukprot:CCA24105.1 AlNc14C222G9131 [Albugo laibachii Nc14]
MTPDRMSSIAWMYVSLLNNSYLNKNEAPHESIVSTAEGFSRSKMSPKNSFGFKKFGKATTRWKELKEEFCSVDPVFAGMVATIGQVLYTYYLFFWQVYPETVLIDHPVRENEHKFP